MFHVELAPLGGIFGPLKSDLGVFWPFRATDFIMGILKIWDNFLGPNGPILKFTFLESLRNLWLFGINKKDGCFFRFRTPSRPMWGRGYFRPSYGRPKFTLFSKKREANLRCPKKCISQNLQHWASKLKSLLPIDSGKKYRAGVPTILMPPTFPIASLNRYTPNFSEVPQKLTWCQQFGRGCRYLSPRNGCF